MKNYYLKIKQVLNKTVYPLIKRRINTKYSSILKGKGSLYKKFNASIFKKNSLKLKKLNFIFFIKRIKLNKKIIENIKIFNFRKLKKINPENAILYFFFTIGFFSSLTILLLISRPLNNKNSQIFEEIKLSRSKKAEINSLSLNLVELKNAKEKINKDTLFLINLIGGTENLDTFIASLNKLAIENKVSINNIEPKEIQKSEQYNPKDNTQINGTEIKKSADNSIEDQIVKKEDYMLVPELEKHIIELSVDSEFIKVLEFIRDVELLENIVLIDDFKIVRLKDILKESKSEIKYSTSLSAFGRVKNIILNKYDSKNKL